MCDHSIGDLSPPQAPPNTFGECRSLQKIISIYLSPLRCRKRGLGPLETGSYGSVVIINNNNTPREREIYNFNMPKRMLKSILGMPLSILFLEDD